MKAKSLNFLGHPRIWLGKKKKEYLRFSVSIWTNFCCFCSLQKSCYFCSFYVEEQSFQVTSLLMSCACIPRRRCLALAPWQGQMLEGRHGWHLLKILQAALVMGTRVHSEQDSNEITKVTHRSRSSKLVFGRGWLSTCSFCQLHIDLEIWYTLSLWADRTSSL